MADSIHFENSQQQQKIKAEKALEKAKAIEREKLNNGKKYQKKDRKTWVLK